MDQERDHNQGQEKAAETQVLLAHVLLTKGDALFA
jgi:hypothetical protein